jgi:hypothetical protein
MANFPLMPDWLSDRITAAGGEFSGRYEASLYGPVCAFLTKHFPVDQQFMVKPQGKIRPSFESATDDLDDLVRISLDSYADEVLPRDQPGAESGVEIPDFIVVKASRGLHGDRVLVVIEVKRIGVSVDSGVVRLGEYMGAFADKTTSSGLPLFNSLRGMLVIGSMVKLVELSHPTAPLLIHPGVYNILGDNVHTFLQQVAAVNQN